MDLPSGRILTEQDLVLVRMMPEVGFVSRTKEPVTLKSGVQSNVYVFGREDATDNPRFLEAVGQKIARTVRSAQLVDAGKIPCLIGIPTAATPMAVAASLADLHGFADVYGVPPIASRIMRESQKSHGAHGSSWVNGRANTDRHEYWTVDNVVTNGDSKFEADAHLVESGYPAKTRSLIFVDRQQGGVERMRAAGFQHIEVCFYLLDLAFAFGELGIWPKEAVKSVAEEIHAHQFPDHPTIVTE